MGIDQLPILSGRRSVVHQDALSDRWLNGPLFGLWRQPVRRSLFAMPDLSLATMEHAFRFLFSVAENLPSMSQVKGALWQHRRIRVAESSVDAEQGYRLERPVGLKRDGLIDPVLCDGFPVQHVQNAA